MIVQPVKSKAVYPRWRGEHMRRQHLKLRLNGLSPLARGTRRHFHVPFGVRRFIPAGAGNTLNYSVGKMVFTVYPRWRGEHFKLFCRENGIHGLSPLARGTPHIMITPLPSHRFIPAGAGNTFTLQTQQDIQSVYPRWRGEHFYDFWYSLRGDGLSPLARGTLLLPARLKPAFRFIPAGAGNTRRSCY